MVIAMVNEQTVGARLRKLRLKNGYSQEDLADAMLVSRETIRNWESDLCEPPCTALLELSALYHVSTDYILGASDIRVIHLDRLSPDQAEIISILVKTIEARERKETAQHRDNLHPARSKDSF